MSGAATSVELTANSLYEAAALSLAMFRKDGWTEPVGQGTELEVLVSQPATKHVVTIAQVRRWREAVTWAPARC
jgi:hypothetical protein